jgi:5-methylcytosine-specific restriction endonuclease McrA
MLAVNIGEERCFLTRHKFRKEHFMVFVLDKHKKPLMPCTEKRARLLLERGRARIHKMEPFTIRIVDRLVEDSVLQPVSLKLDPGSKFTGIALVKETEHVSYVISLLELEHRGQLIHKKMEQRANYRRRRRTANLRYRAPRFNNRRKRDGWLAPSIQHRVDSTVSFAAKLMRLCPVSQIAAERVKFDMQLLDNPEIKGIEYQQGTLTGYEVREYLLEKWGRKCAYCGAENVPLEIEHITPKARGGTNAVSNLTLACHSCNQRKGALPVEDFLKHKPDVLKRVQSQRKRPLKDAAAVNATRNALWRRLSEFGLPLTGGSGGLTKYNRIKLGIPKAHCLDAVCVGQVEAIADIDKKVMAIRCMGRGSRQRTRVNKYGFPRGYLMREKSVHGFATGDIVKAIVTKGKKIGCYRGRVAVRKSGSFNIQTADILIQGISRKYCQILARNDGYCYSLRDAVINGAA